MILGKITVTIEQINGRQRWIYCRPYKYANNSLFRQVIGVAHAIYLEKCFLTENIVRDRNYTFYGIFDKIPTNEQMDTGYIVSKVQPISEEVFNELIQIYPQENHRFLP